MTELLKQAFREASQLPPNEQDVFARWMLHVIESEKRWNELFARSPELLETKAAEAVAEHEAGLTDPLDPESME